MTAEKGPSNGGITFDKRVEKPSSEDVAAAVNVLHERRARDTLLNILHQLEVSSFDLKTVHEIDSLAIASETLNDIEAYALEGLHQLEALTTVKRTNVLGHEATGTSYHNPFIAKYTCSLMAADIVAFLFAIPGLICMLSTGFHSMWVLVDRTNYAGFDFGDFSNPLVILEIYASMWMTFILPAVWWLRGSVLDFQMYRIPTIGLNLLLLVDRVYAWWVSDV